MVDKLTPTFIFEPASAGMPHMIASIQITIAVVIVMHVARFPPPGKCEIILISFAVINKCCFVCMRLHNTKCIRN